MIGLSQMSRINARCLPIQVYREYYRLRARNFFNYLTNPTTTISSSEQFPHIWPFWASHYQLCTGIPGIYYVGI